MEVSLPPGLLSEAVCKAEASECGERHGAVLFTGRRCVLSSASNSYGTKVAGGFTVPSCHAECKVLRPLEWGRSTKPQKRFESGSREGPKVGKACFLQE